MHDQICQIMWQNQATLHKEKVSIIDHLFALDNACYRGCVVSFILVS
jgi:hypothetical protein